MQKPQGSLLFSGKPVVDQETVITGHEFDINVTAQDDESGIESAFLYRDDTLISALFNSGQSVHREQPLALNQSLRLHQSRQYQPAPDAPLSFLK